MKKFVLIFMLITIMFLPSPGKGNFEINLHYSSWTVDMIAPMVEESLVPDIEYYDPDLGSLTFDSNGNNYGIELRFFPGGKNGSFSLGLSYEKNNFKMKVDGAYEGFDDVGNPIKAEASGTFDLYPHSINVSLRWELWPSKRIHPYIGFGVGFGVQDALVKFHSKLTTDIGGVDIVEEEDEIWTFEDLKNEYKIQNGEDFPIGFFPVIHISFGFRGELVNNIYLLGEVAFYDGLIFRGGLSYRF